MSEDPGCVERFLYAVLATVMKPISDLRLLISGLLQERRSDPNDLGATNRGSP
jgi:hypothetical protein